jgi:hypothetical protein
MHTARATYGLKERQGSAPKSDAAAASTRVEVTSARVVDLRLAVNVTRVRFNPRCALSSSFACALHRRHNSPACSQNPERGLMALACAMQQRRHSRNSKGSHKSLTCLIPVRPSCITH